MAKANLEKDDSFERFGFDFFDGDTRRMTHISPWGTEEFKLTCLPGGRMLHTDFLDTDSQGNPNHHIVYDSES